MRPAAPARTPQQLPPVEHRARCSDPGYADDSSARRQRQSFVVIGCIARTYAWAGADGYSPDRPTASEKRVSTPTLRNGAAAGFCAGADPAAAGDALGDGDRGIDSGAAAVHAALPARARPSVPDPGRRAHHAGAVHRAVLAARGLGCRPLRPAAHPDRRDGRLWRRRYRARLPRRPVRDHCDARRRRPLRSRDHDRIDDSDQRLFQRARAREMARQPDRRRIPLLARPDRHRRRARQRVRLAWSVLRVSLRNVARHRHLAADVGTRGRSRPGRRAGHIRSRHARVSLAAPSSESARSRCSPRSCSSRSRRRARSPSQPLACRIRHDSAC